MDHVNWRKSSYSSGNGGECVEVASPGGALAVRDTKQNGAGPVLRFTAAAWRGFAEKLKHALAPGTSPARWGKYGSQVRVAGSFGPNSGS
jgi:hypothetical protein